MWDQDTSTLDGYDVDSVKRGSLSEFRHNSPIPDNLQRNAEV